MPCSCSVLFTFIGHSKKTLPPPSSPTTTSCNGSFDSLDSRKMKLDSTSAHSFLSLKLPNKIRSCGRDGGVKKKGILDCQIIPINSADVL